MAQNAFGHLIPGAQPTQTPMQPQGDPILKPADPYKQSAEARAQAGEARAGEDQAMQRQRFQQDQERLALERERVKQEGIKATGEQSKAAGFLLRALKSNDTYEAQQIGPRSLVGQTLSEIAPSALNSLPSGVGNSPQRQVADVTQGDFIAATLRYESGAAIPPAEMEAQRRRYFPMPGDGPEALAAKAELRRTAIEALRTSSGAIGEKTYQDYMGPQGEGLTGGVVTDTSPQTPIAGTAPPTDGSPPNGTPPDGVPSVRSMQDPGGFSGLASLATRGVTLGLSDEAAGVGNYLGALLTGQNPADAYVTGRDSQRQFDQQAAQQWGMAGGAMELLGGGGAARIASVPNSLMGAAGQAATIGGLAGFGSGEGAGGSAANALLGASVGGGIGAAGQYAGNALAARAAARTPDMAVVQAGQRQGIPIRQPDARPNLRGQAAQIESTQTGGPMIRAAREGDQAAIEQRIADVGGQGAASDPYALGTRVQGAGQRYIARTKAQATRLYDKARELSGDATVTPRNADAVLDQNIQELRAAGENSNASAISYLEGLRNDIDRGLTLSSVQNLRTNMRGQIGEKGLTGTDTERRVGQVLDAMNQDLTEQLPKEASAALRAADGFYKERQTFINDTLKQFMGNRGNPLPAETAAQRLVSMAQGKGNLERFSSMWKQLEPTEQADVAATIAHSLGRRANGEFSAAMLVRALDPSKGINPRTARLVFGEDGARALQDLRVIAQAKTDTMGRQSPSGVAINAGASGLKKLILGAMGFASGGPVGAAAGAMSQSMIQAWGEQRAARMLLNPDFTRWLRNMPNTSNPQAINRYFGRLATTGIAANDNAAFQQAIMQAFKASPTSAAAQDEANGRRVPPQQ